MFGIIGGTGLYELDTLEDIETLRPETPFGPASSPIITGKIADHPVAFLARHGHSHEYLPHEVNYRANIYALKSIGVKQLMSISAVGSLWSEIKPGDFVLIDQYIDFTKGIRKHTFFGEGLSAHISSAEPTCSEIANKLQEICLSVKMKAHMHKTYVCVEGPRLGTRAESKYLQSTGAHVVGMTNVPEVFLAREAQMAYCTLGIVTDYDCWLADSSFHVSTHDVLKVYKENLEKVKKLINSFFESGGAQIESSNRKTLEKALLSDLSKLSDNKRKLWQVLSA